MRARALVAAAVAAALLAALPSIAEAETRFHPGAASAHDPLVPGYGNGGYDVLHYGVWLRYSPTAEHLVGHARVRATATTNLSRFNLDFALPVRSVRIDGEPARFKVEAGPSLDYGKELVVTPPQGILEGSTFRVLVRYAADPFDVKVNGLSLWNRTPTGVTVWNEPTAAAQWLYPNNGYPSDKATYDLTVATRKSDRVLFNGLMVSRTVHGRRATTHWRVTSPMMTTLSFLTIGRFKVVRGALSDGTPTYFAYERGGGAKVAAARRYVERTPQVIDWLSRRFGPYPFEASGAIVSRIKYPTAIETQTRATYTPNVFTLPRQEITTVVHETAHQWFGDAVTMQRWHDIWLAEGFASYVQWLWSADHDKGSAEHHFERTYHRYRPSNPWWRVAVVNDRTVLPIQAYRRGAMALQALRNKVGSPTFFTIMRTYVDRYRDGNASTDDFMRIASKTSGMRLSRFFTVWLFSHHRPAPTVRNGFPADFRFQ